MEEEVFLLSTLWMSNRIKVLLSSDTVKSLPFCVFLCVFLRVLLSLFICCWLNSNTSSKNLNSALRALFQFYWYQSYQSWYWSMLLYYSLYVGAKNAMQSLSVNPAATIRNFLQLQHRRGVFKALQLFSSQVQIVNSCLCSLMCNWTVQTTSKAARFGHVFQGKGTAQTTPTTWSLW